MNNDNDFDFSGYPKLGRPFQSGAKRDKYIKFYLSEIELDNFNKQDKKIASYFEKKGYLFNRPSFMRCLLENVSNEKLLDSIFDNLSDEIKDNYKINKIS